MSEGFIVWFTGLSGSGKSTLSAMLAAELARRGVHVEVLDGDEVRTHLSKGLSFSKEDRDINIRRIGFVAKLLARAGACVMTAAISPYRAIREEQRRHTPRFVEVYCECAVPVLAERDIKGLYKKALAGEIKHFTGIDDPYEPPERPEVTVHTGAESREQSLMKIVAKLEELGYIPWHSLSYEIAGESPAERLRSSLQTDQKDQKNQKNKGKRLPPPHGGELCERYVKGRTREELLEKINGMPVIDAGVDAANDIELICSGALSPLKGFMGSKDYLRVLKEMRLENGLPFALPVTLPIPRETAGHLKIGATAALRARSGAVIAVIEIHDLFEPERELEARAGLHLNENTKENTNKNTKRSMVYAGGEVIGLDRLVPPMHSSRRLDPAEARTILADRSHFRVAGFWTRGPVSREHEHWTKAALELCDGLLIHLDTGGANGQDAFGFSLDARMRACEILIERYYPKDRVLLGLYPGTARASGPRQSLFEAIVHKNYGCSRLLVERTGREGSVPDVFESFSAAELGIEPWYVERAFYSAAAGGMATNKTAPAGETARIYGDTAALWQTLQQNKNPPAEAWRPEVIQTLLNAMQSNSIPTE